MHPSQRLVQLVKWLVATLLRLTGVLRWLRLRRARNGRVAVLWLHRVDGTGDARLPMAVPPDVFSALVRSLSKSYVIDDWSGCVASARAPDGRPRVAITFDDGYRDNAATAWPILREAGAHGIFFLTTSFVDGGRTLWWELIAATHTSGERYPIDRSGEATYGTADPVIEALKRVPNEERERVVERAAEALTEPIDAASVPVALTWADAARMAEEGAVLGGHTVAHPVMTRCSDAELRRELGCRRAIAARLGVDATAFAYPNGSYDERVEGAVEAAGYSFAFTTEKGTYCRDTDPHRIPRIGVSEPKYSLDGRGFSWNLFEAEMLGVFDLLLLRRARRGASQSN